MFTITETDKKELKNILKKRTIQVQTSNRAKILLLKAEGKTIDETAEETRVNRKSVMLCLKKYKEGGIKRALYDDEGRGRNSEITDEEKSIIIDIACKKPKDFG